MNRAGVDGRDKSRGHGGALAWMGAMNRAATESRGLGWAR